VYDNCSSTPLRHSLSRSNDPIFLPLGLNLAYSGVL
jgi:hypothetical protein